MKCHTASTFPGHSWGMCWLSCSPMALPEQDSPVSSQTSRLQHAAVYTSIHCLVWSILHGFLACRESLQSNSPSSQKIQEEFICYRINPHLQPCAQALTPRGPGRTSSATTGTASLSPHPKGHQSGGQEREALPKLCLFCRAPVADFLSSEYPATFC